MDLALISSDGVVVPLELAKEHLRVTDAAEDELIQGLIDAAVAYVESASRRSLAVHQYVLTLPAFPALIELPRPPVLTVDAIRYYPTLATDLELSATEYLLCGAERPTLIPVGSWPSTAARPDAVQISYTAGYDGTGASIPECLQQAILLLVGHWYEHREAAADNAVVEVPLAVSSLIAAGAVGSYP